MTVADYRLSQVKLRLVDADDFAYAVHRLQLRLCLERILCFDRDSPITDVGKVGTTALGKRRRLSVRP